MHMETTGTTASPVPHDVLRQMLVVAGLHGAEIAARGAPLYAIEGIPGFVKHWHGKRLPDWLLQEPLAIGLVDDSLFRTAKYAWMQWRLRRTPDRNEFPDPPTPAWIAEYAEHESNGLAGELSAIGELLEAGDIQHDGQTGEPPGPIPDVVQSLFF